MIITTTPTVEGRPIAKYLGLLSGVCFLDEGLFQTKEAVMLEARQRALANLSARAEEAGADAIVGVDLDFVIDHSRYYVVATGTAVLIP